MNYVQKFSILNSKPCLPAGMLSMNYQLPITNVATIWKMVNGKHLVKGKWLIVNEVDGVRV